MDQVILVDDQDRPVGTADKLAAHQGAGQLHRAFSIFVHDGRRTLLLQRRARAKYHFGGLWSNACCGHPRPGEPLVDAARRRLQEELGIEAELGELFSFIYTATDPGSGLTERELDHVLIGQYSGPLTPDPDEIDDVQWLKFETVRRRIQERPGGFTPWFLLAGPRVIQTLSSMGS